VKRLSGEPRKMRSVSLKMPALEFNIWMPILSGLLTILIHPPISLFPLAFISLVPLFLSLRKDRPYQNLLAGMLSGMVGYMGTVYWVVVAMSRYGGLDIVSSILIMIVLVLYMSFYVGVFCYSITYLESRLSIPIYLSAPIIWVVLEYIRGFLLTGFPWVLLAYSQHIFLPFIQVASITGIYFISFMIVAINCIFYSIWSKKRIPLYYIIITAVLFSGSIVYGFIRLNSDSPGIKRHNVTIIQGNISQDIKWDAYFKAKTVKKYYEMTLNNSRGSSLVVWPETAMPFAINTAKQIDELLKSLAVSTNTDILFGTVHMEDGDIFYNSAYVFDKQGKTAGIYNKVHLVPFGEYTPLKDYIPFLSKITAAGGSFSPGKSHRPIPTSSGDIGVLICYEGIFPNISLDTVRKGAQVLVNITNDAWYDRTSAPYQHLSFYVFRAIETERYIIRAANTGISAIIDHRGRIRAKTPIFEDAVVKGDFSLSNSMTFYARYGEWFMFLVFICLVFLIGISLIKTLRKRF